MDTFIRSDQARIHVRVYGVNYPSVTSWASLEGGDLTSEDVKTRPGGLLPQVNLGGPTTRNDLTVTRQYSIELHPWIVALENVCGIASMKVTYEIFDPSKFTASKNFNPQQESSFQTFKGVVTITGILKSVTRPNFNANTPETAFLALVMGCDAVGSYGTN